jgi:chromosomal replication initiator protein
MSRAVSDDLAHSWEQIQVALRENVGERTYGLWLAPLRCVGLDGDTLVLEGPPEVSAWASARLGPALRTASASVLGRAVAVHVAPGDGAAAATTPRPATAAAPAQPSPQGGTAPNPTYTFEQFVIGTSNRLAHAAALSVAEMPTQAYNPLFIYGPPGLGKTHLLHSIGNYIQAFGGGLSVRYATAEDFTNAFLAALAARDTEQFKARFRGVDVLLIDDVQFLERKARSEEEMFHTFNALYDAGSQLVITCDRLPADLAGIEYRLRERFASGLVTDIERPDRATRLTILRRRAAFDQLEISDDALALLADNITSNVRALEGALIRVVAFASLQRRPLDAALAAEALGRHGLTVAGTTEISIAQIQAAACAHFGLQQNELLSRSRIAKNAWARQAAMYLCRELTSYSLPHIGREFGGRDHTTILHACRRVVSEIAHSPAAFNDIETLTGELSTID